MPDHVLGPKNAEIFELVLLLKEAWTYLCITAFIVCVCVYAHMRLFKCDMAVYLCGWFLLELLLGKQEGKGMDGRMDAWMDGYIHSCMEEWRQTDCCHKGAAVTSILSILP